ncbi:MAG: M48 family metallopeptidase [Lacipirellulaceae bacterium]
MTHQHLEAAFDKKLKKNRPSIAYRIGIMLAAMTMVGLVAVYLLLIAVCCYGVYYHFVNHTGMLQMRGGGRARVLVFLVYAAPGIIGPIIIFFLIKPLLARPAKVERFRSLNRDREPLLFDFVEKVCKAVGSPVPKRIDIDCDVNASASFRRGFLSFLGRDLVLTIGLPVVAGLSLREFGGVLAHEFGHFSQGAGMRLSYVVRSISSWFMRVVYERDQWDETLSSATEDVDIRVGWIILVAQGGVALGRGVLWVLMHIGVGVSGLLLRQMEFDADRCETRFAGHKAFASTSRKMRLLSVASELSNAQIFEHLGSRRLVKDLPALILLNTKMMPPNIADEIVGEALKEKTNWYDTHPCDADRIKAAEKLGDEGAFSLKAPAAALFTDFKGQSEATTWHLYMGTFGANVPKDSLVGPREYITASKAGWAEA